MLLLDPQYLELILKAFFFCLEGLRLCLLFFQLFKLTLIQISDLKVIEVNVSEVFRFLLACLISCDHLLPSLLELVLVFEDRVVFYLIIGFSLCVELLD